MSLGRLITLFSLSWNLGLDYIVPQSPIKTYDSSLAQDAYTLFRYDPAIRITKSGSTTDALIFLHGFGGDGTDIQQCVPQDIQVTCFTFDFKDRPSSVFLLHTSLGQLPEVLVAAFVANHVYKSGYTTVSLFGLSRGGNVALNLLRVLADPAYDIHCRKIGIEDKDGLLKVLKRGAISLQVPLTDSVKAIKKAIPVPIIDSLVACCFGIISKHSVRGLQGKKSVEWLCNNNHLFTSLWYMQNQDELIPNDTMQECIDLRKKYNAEKTFSFAGDGYHVSEPNDAFKNKAKELLGIKKS